MRRGLVVCLLALACRGRATAKTDAQPAAACVPDRHELPGLLVEKTVECVILVHADPARFAPRLLTARADGGSRTASEWAQAFGLAGVINASMFAPDRRSIGLLVAGQAVNNDHDNPKLGAFLAFDPVDPADAPLLFTVRDCPGFDLAGLRRRYRSIVQNYRLLDCAGQPLPWKDEELHSAAAVGLDARGWLVFIHARHGVKMSEFARALAAPGVALRGAMYVEGGPEAALLVRAGDVDIADDTGMFFSIPNVLGLLPREKLEAKQ